MISCRTCGAENREERKFCGDCGAPQPRACPECAFENLGNDRFCGGCGKALTISSKPAAGERREVTVLFADIAGYTRLSGELDPEDTHSLLERFFEITDGVVARFGGRVDKHIGDNVMAVFGAPTAHDNDPERAVRAAEEIHRRVETMTGARKIKVHIGLATGEVIASALGSTHHQEYGVIGDTVNLAARLQDKASAGQTVVSEVVRNATATFARYTDLGEIELKGFKHPVRPFRFEGLLDTRVERAGRAFVGREAELALLCELLSLTASKGKGETVVVRGEAGIGKTRLLSEIRAAAERIGYRCHRALILDFGEGAGQGPVRMLAEQLLGVAERASPVERRAAVERAIRDGAVDAERTVPLAMLLDCVLTDSERIHAENMTQSAREAELRGCIAELVERSVANGPLFLSFEDAHWADAVTSGYLAAIAELVARYPIVLAITTRREGDILKGPHRALFERASPRIIELTPFSAEDAARLAGDGAPRELLNACIERSGGNPLFLEQLLEAGNAGSGTALPSTLQSVVLARLDRLDPQSRNALQVASVFGQRFSPEAVRRALGDPDYGFDGLIATGLLRPEGEGLLFKHALIQEGVYQALTRSRRRELHLKAAELEADPVLRAQHFDRAQDPRAAISYVEAAGAQLSHQLLDSALSLATRGRELADSDDARFALGMKRGEIFQAKGVHRDAVKAYEDALAHARGDAARCRALLALASAQRYAGDYRALEETVRRAQPLAEGLQDDDSRSALHYHLGGLAFTRGERDPCMRENERALEFATRSGNGERIARAHSGLGDAHFLGGDYDASGRHFTRCLELCEELGLERFSTPNRAMLANVLSIQGFYREAVAMCERAYEVATRLGDERGAFFARQELTLFKSEMVPLDEATTLVVACADEAERLGLGMFVAMMNAYAADALLTAGNREEARRRIRVAVEADEKNGVGRFSGPSKAVLAKMEGDPARRRQLLAEGREESSRFTEYGMLSFFRLAVDAALEHTDLPLAETYVADWVKMMEGRSLPFFDRLLLSAQLRTAVLAGKRDPSIRVAMEKLVADLREDGLVGSRLPVEAALQKISNADATPTA